MNARAGEARAAAHADYTPHAQTQLQVSTRILGGRSAPFAPFLVSLPCPAWFYPVPARAPCWSETPGAYGFKNLLGEAIVCVCTSTPPRAS